MNGLNDQIRKDIQAAVRFGHFDRFQDEGLSELQRTPVGELYRATEMMSPARRRSHLARLGAVRTGEQILTGGRTTKRTRRILSE